MGAGLGMLEVPGQPECSVCMEEYIDEGLKVPRNLHCGHSFCTGKTMLGVIASLVTME